MEKLAACLCDDIYERMKLGQSADTCTRYVDYLVTTENEVENGTAKVNNARKWKIPIVSENYLQDCIKQKKLLKHTKYLLEGADEEEED